MKKLLLALSVGAALAGTAHAVPVTYAYTARVDYLYAFTPPQQIDVANEVTYAGHTIRMGDVFTGKFSYDTATPLSLNDPNYQPGTFAMYESVAMPNTLSGEFAPGVGFQAGRLPVNIGRDVLVSAWNNNQNGFDEFRIQGFNDTLQQNSGMLLVDYQGKALDSSELPLALDLDAFSWGNAYFSYRDFATGVFYMVSGDLESLQAIPEPASAALMLSGLGLLAATRRRKASRAQ